MDDSNFEKQKWEEELKRRPAERQHDRMTEFEKQTNEAAISSGQLALRTAVLINGGAAVSVLAFLGSLAKDKLSDSTLSGVAGPLLWFASGVAVAAAGLGLALLCQLRQWRALCIARTHLGASIHRAD